MKNKIYIVEYCGGEYEDRYTNLVFATRKKETAERYVKRFNGLLEKWKDIHKDLLMNALDDYRAKDIHQCYFYGVESR